MRHAQKFRLLHQQDRPLILVNAWDAASARLLESSGAAAIATTSAGIAWTLGYADGERMPMSDMLDACRRICRSVQVPVSADIERGFGETAAAAAGNVQALLDVGIVGINIEDGIDGSTGRVHDLGVLAGQIAAIRKVADAAGVALFINARIDTYFAAASDPIARYEATVHRAQVYINCGADGIFVPGLVDLEEIAKLAWTIGKPLNVYAGHSGVPPIAALAQANVKRVSLGCGPLQASLALTRRIAIEAIEKGTYDAMTADMLSAKAVNALFE